MAKTLIDVLEEQNFELKDGATGRKLMRCVFHDGDNQASLTIYPPDEKKGEPWNYYCFACGAWGDALKFLVDYKQMSADEATKYLGDDYVPTKRKNKPSGVIKIQNEQVTWKFLYDVAEIYHQYLLETPGALNYLHSRGLNDETISKYKLGYTDGAVLKVSWAWEMEIATKMGVLAHSGYELMSHRITIPNLLDNHYCDFIVGRTVVNERAKYLNTHGPKPMLGFYEVRNSPIIFLVEGQMDYLTLRQWGIAAAVIGGSKLSKSQKNLLYDKKIVILPDYDPSGVGQNTALSLKEAFGKNAMILDYSELNPDPNDKLDINTLATIPGAEEKFKEIIIREVPWIGSLSTRQLMKYFPTLNVSTDFHSISKLRASRP